MRCVVRWRYHELFDLAASFSFKTQVHSSWSWEKQQAFSIGVWENEKIPFIKGDSPKISCISSNYASRGISVVVVVVCVFVFSWFAFSRMRTVWEERDSIFRGSRSQPHLPFHIKQTVLSSRAKSGQLCLMPAKKYSDCPSSGLFNELKPTVCTASFWYHPLQDLLAKELPLSVMFMVLI